MKIKKQLSDFWSSLFITVIEVDDPRELDQQNIIINKLLKCIKSSETIEQLTTCRDWVWSIQNNCKSKTSEMYFKLSGLLDFIQLKVDEIETVPSMY